MPALQRGAALDGEPVRTLALYGGAIRVRAPEGYCIDLNASRSRDGFALMAGCALISDAEIMPAIDALIVVQAGADGTAMVIDNAADLAALLRTDQGRDLLAASGQGGDVTVGAVMGGPNLISVRFDDASTPLVDGTSPDTMRAFLDVGARLVVVTVREYDRNPLTDTQALRLLRQAVTQIKDVNAPARRS